MKDIEEYYIDNNISKEKLKTFEKLVSKRLQELFNEYYKNYNNLEECQEIIYTEYLKFIKEMSIKLDKNLEKNINDNIEDLRKNYNSLYVIIGGTNISTYECSTDTKKSIIMLDNNIIKSNQEKYN